MIHKLILLAFVAASALLLAGCAAVAPMTAAAGSLLNPSPPGQVTDLTSIRLDQDNFEVVRTNVVGRSKGFSLLGLITIWPATLTKATQQLYANAQLDLGRAQTPAHLIVERSSSYWILFGIPRVDVSADIIEFRRSADVQRNDRPAPASGPSAP